MNPLDTHDYNHVPLTEAFRQRLAIDRTTPGAGVVYAIASDALVLGPAAAGDGPV